MKKGKKTKKKCVKCTCNGQIIEIPKEEIDKAMQEQIDMVSITEDVTKAFTEDGEWVQNEYWESDGNNDKVICASFINIDLDQLSVFIDEDINGEDIS